MRLGGLLIFALAVLAGVSVFYFNNSVAVYMNAGAAEIFALFKNENFPLVLAAGLVAIAAALLLAYRLFIITPQSLHLRNLRKQVLKFVGEDQFAENFDDISARLSKSALIGHAWKEFSETLVPPGDGVSVVQNTTRPQTFINYTCAQEHSTALRLMTHLPNYFVGVGLLLTFVGLVAALASAESAVGSGSAEKAVEGLQGVLAAATFKFWTSIAGLMSSIVLSFVFRLYTLSLERSFAQLCRALESRMSFATPQRIFVDVRNAIEEQLSETKKINTEVAMSIADGVGRQIQEQMPTLLADALKPVVDAVDESTRKVGEGASEGVGAMVDQFAKTIEGSASQHIRDLSSTLEKLQVSLSETHGSMSNSSDQFARRMAEGSERLDETMRDIAASMRELIEGLKTEVGQAGQAFGSSLEESLNRLNQQSEEMAKKMAEESQGVSAAFREEIENAAKALSASADDNARSAAEFGEQLRASLNDSVQKVQSNLDRLSTALISVDAQLAKQGEGMTAVAARSNETARLMSDAAEKMRDGLTPFQEVARGISETSQSLERSVSGLAQRVDTAVTSIENVSSSLTSVSETLELAWTNYYERFESVDEDLEATFNKLHEAVEQQQRQVFEFVRQLDTSFEKALNGLSGGIEGIGMSVEDLIEAVEKMNGVNRLQ